MHLALSFFITMYKDFFTQRNNAVLINSVCSFNWGSSKSEDFVRNKCKLFFFNSLKLLIPYICNEIVLLDSWKVMYLPSLKLHSTIFIFLPKDELSLFEI